MRASEFIVEATPQSLQPPVLDKLFKTYQTRDINDQHIPKFEDGLQVADFIFKAIGPKSLIWVVKQYNTDRYFFLHDLPQWKSTIEEFDRLKADKRIQLPKNDLGQYTNINELRNAIDQFSTDQQSHGSKFYSKAIIAIDKFVKNGDAEWLYRGSDYSIYHPITFESSNICKSLMSTTLCTIMNDEQFEYYSDVGTLMYIIDQSKLYNCYISNNSENDGSEFADEKNNHDYDLSWMLSKFPNLKPLIKSVMGDYTELYVKLAVSDNKEDKYQVCLDAVSIYGGNLQWVPEELRTPEICEKAIAETGMALAYVPKELRTYKICLDSVFLSPSALYYVPQELRTPELCKIAVSRYGGALANVPEELKTPELCNIAVSQYGSSLRHVPIELRTLELCKKAISKSDLALSSVPRSIRDQVRDEVYKEQHRQNESQEFDRLKELLEGLK